MLCCESWCQIGRLFEVHLHTKMTLVVPSEKSGELIAWALAATLEDCGNGGSQT